ncbi:hypothetical protein LSH36_2240g00003 [Paralvinella palmiformis]|uniref:Uncharacterized protein n=1 Tax=Paralvinella palmiformis TaxID=53620 RepID=A0AAD9IRH4_9ANNE|nr:hypothetical protein LSH36_2240g00003 [Paralvinella palmiformis]
MLLIIAQNEGLIDLIIRNLVHNVGLYNEAKLLEEQLKPIAVALDSLQSDTATIADASEQWCVILVHTDNVLEPHKAKITRRFNQAMTPTHYLANMLHPIYRDRNLRPKHIDTAEEYVLEELVAKPYISLREFGGVEFRVKSSFPRTTSWERRRAGELPFKNSLLFVLIETYLLRMSGSM